MGGVRNKIHKIMKKREESVGSAHKSVGLQIFEQHEGKHDLKIVLPSKKHCNKGVASHQVTKNTTQKSPKKETINGNTRPNEAED